MPWNCAFRIPSPMQQSSGLQEYSPKPAVQLLQPHIEAIWSNERIWTIQRFFCGILFEDDLPRLSSFHMSPSWLTCRHAHKLASRTEPSTWRTACHPKERHAKSPPVIQLLCTKWRRADWMQRKARPQLPSLWGNSKIQRLSSCFSKFKDGVHGSWQKSKAPWAQGPLPKATQIGRDSSPLAAHQKGRNPYWDRRALLRSLSKKRDFLPGFTILRKQITGHVWTWSHISELRYPGKEPL